MSLNEAGRAPANSRWRGTRVVIVAAAIVFGGFVALGATTSGYGLLGFVILVLAALLESRATEEAGRLAPAGGRSRKRGRAARSRHHRGA